ncbi:hypothetical protein [Rhizobium sp. NFR03]|uniref:hypothetical protein n=1 Tax=Rhizobium sp. NFR03 TaxID=1566263 RepID=UPI0008B44A64|nr:hypothetical protein [Rhizobium sp. NFR03]SER57984.1 hypothetical protein SAMN03159406_00556 [Rhizobium sp. NFR03]
MPAVFDLFGDEVPEGWGKRGRPPHLVDDKKRCKVRLLLAMGRKEAEIAAALGITEPTLRKHYFRELACRQTARFQLEGTVLLRLYEEVEAGNVAAIKELGKKIDKAAIADSDFARRVAEQSQPKKAVKLGKKEQALQDARTPDTATPLGRLMAMRTTDSDKLN